MALLVRGVGGDSSVECGEFRGEGRVIHAKALQFDDCRAGWVLVRRAGHGDRVATTRCLPVGGRVGDRLLTEFMQV
jgi:hypothetical protein